MPKPKPRKKLKPLEKRLALVAAQLPPKMTAKLLVKFLAREREWGEDDAVLAVETVKAIIQDAWIYKGLDNHCNLSLSVDDNFTPLLVEEMPLGEFFRELWEDLEFRELSETVGPKVAAVLGKWMMVFAGKAEPPDKN